MEKEKVSIIIPVYNTAKYLCECLNSIISQTFKNIEIIVVNDHSTDNSLQIINDYKKIDSRISIINLETNSGLSVARNTGIQTANGKYIIFVDSDDWISKKLVETLYNSITAGSCDAIMATHYTFDNLTKKIKTFRQKEEFYNKQISTTTDKQKFLTLRMIWSAWNKIYRKDFLTKNNIYFKTAKMEDILFIYELITAPNSKIMLIKDVLYYYRINRENSIMLNKTDRIYDCIRTISTIKQNLISADLFETYKKSFYPYAALLFAAEFEVSNLPLKKLKEISYSIKHDFFEDMQIQFYATYDKFLYKIRLLCFYLCLKSGINYAILGKIMRKIYNLSA